MILFRKHPILWIKKNILGMPVMTPENFELVELDLDKNSEFFKNWFDRSKSLFPTTYVDKNWNVQDVTVWDWLALYSAKHKKTNIS